MSEDLTGVRVIGAWWRVTLLWFVLIGAAMAQDNDPAAPPAPPTIDGDVGDALRIGLMTVAPGDVYWQRFGHNAIIVDNLVRGESRLYNFGTFDFEQKNFFLNFLRGRMEYQLAEGSPGRDVSMYAEEGRGVTVAWLDLTPDQRYAVAEMLAENALPENSAYRYDYFIDNCSTRVRDVLDRVTSGSLREQLSGRSEGATYRQLALQYGRAEPWMAIGMDLGLGRHADRPLSFWAQSFIPEQFERFVLEQTNPETGRRLVAEHGAVLEASAVSETGTGSWHWIWFGALSVVFSALWFLASRRPVGALRTAATSFALLLNLGITGIGLGIAGLMFASEHSMAAMNENLLLFAPTAILLVPVFWRMRRGDVHGGKVAAWIAVALSLLALTLKLDPASQSNALWLALLLPWHAAVWFRTARPMD